MNDDYFFKVQQMDEDELLTEMQKLNTKLYSFTSETGLRIQIENMINLVTQEHQQRMAVRRMAQDKTPDSLVVCPDIALYKCVKLTCLEVMYFSHTLGVCTSAFLWVPVSAKKKRPLL